MTGTPLRWPPFRLVLAHTAFAFSLAPTQGYMLVGFVLFFLLILDAIPGIAGVCSRMMALPAPLLVANQLNTYPWNIITIASMIGVVLVDLWGETRGKDRRTLRPRTPSDPFA